MPAAKVQRAESLRSERSDASQNNKRVSFNNDVDVKHIPRGAVVDRHGRLLGYLPPGDERRLVYNVYKEPTALSEQELAKEAERIIQQVDQITCVVSPHHPTNYETRSLERRTKKNNQEADGQKNWSRTLPSSSTKNKLDKKNNYQNNIVEKNVLHNNQVNVFGSTGSATGSELARKLDPILETSREAMTEFGSMDRSKDTITPKYDSGIEMEAHIHNGHQHGDRPPLTRHNVNLIVQQLTEEARQREELRRRYEEEGIDITPKMPSLPLVEPDPTVGLSHNKNLPFSYTGGSPTRLSPLRPVRLSPPRRTDYEDRSRKNDIIYAQVVVEDGERETGKKTVHTSLATPKDQSPERNLYRSSKGMIDKVPSHGKLFQNNSEIIRQHYGYQEDQEEEDQDDIDAIKAKARFLFGDDGYNHENERQHYRSNKETVRHEPSSLAYTDTSDDFASGNRYKVYKPSYNNFETSNADKINASYTKTNLQNNYRNEANKTTGLSYKYSTLLKDNADKDKNNFTTKVLISTDSESQDRIFQYSDDDDFRNGPESYQKFIRQDRSLSPEPNQRRRPNHREQETRVSVGERIRSFEVNSPDTSPERYRRYRTDDVKQTTNKQQNLTSTQLIREAERGRTTKRPDFTSSRLVQQQVQQIRSTHVNNEEPPKPPLRTKKLRDRLDQNSPPRRTTSSKWNSNERERINEGTIHHNYSQQRTWRRDDNENSPERQISSNKPAFSPPKDYHPSQNYRRKASPDRDRNSDSPENYPRENYGKDRREYYSDNDRRYPRYGYDRREGYRSYEDRSTSPSPERIETHFNTNRRYDVHESDTSGTRTAEPEKQEKIRRQRNKFLAVFLGSSKSNKVKSQPRESRPSGPLQPSSSNSNSLKREVKGQTKKWDNQVDDGLLENHRHTTKTQREVKGPVVTKWQSDISDGYTDSSLRKTETKRDVKVQSQREVNIQGQKESKIQIQREVKGQGQKQNWQQIDDSYRAAAGAGEPITKSTSWVTGYREKPKAFKENQPIRNERRRSSIDRTDTSESDDIREERYKNARQKSQSFSNLQYRRDSDDEDQVDRDQWNTSTLNRLEVRHRRNHQEGKETRSQVRYDMNHETRPYASTNVIREKDELRTGVYDERHRHDYSRDPFPIPEAKNMRYFGDTDLESQQSGNRYRYAPRTKVLRSSSTAAGVSGVKRGLMQRQAGQPVQQQQQQRQQQQQQQQQKQPSSVNSSESEITSQTSNMASGASADSQRSVYLHATTVADIPPAALVSQRRRVQSREDVSRISSSVATTTPSTGATLRRTRHISRSYSVLAPWKPKHYREKYEITYSNSQQPAQMANNMGKPPRPPRRREEPSVDQVDARPVRNSVARSSTMPKDSKLAGWFRKKKR